MSTKIQKIQVILEYFTKGMNKMNTEIKTANAMLSNQTVGIQKLTKEQGVVERRVNRLNKTLRIQQASYRDINSSLRTTTTSLAHYRKSNKDLSAHQKGYVTRQERLITGMRKKNAVISNSIDVTRANIIAQQDGIKITRQKVNTQKGSIAQNKADVVTTRMNEIAQYGLGKMMGISADEFKQFNQLGYRNVTMGGQVANTTRMMTHGLRGFRMEMLGIMFFGMSMTRIFSGLMRTSMQWMGVMDVLSATLGMLFMPVAEKLLDWVLRFMDWVNQLEPETQNMINNFALWGSIMGIVLTVIGTLALGIGSIILVFGKLFGTSAPLKALVVGIKTGFLGLTAPILAIVAIIVAVVIGMIIAWRENFMNMKAVVSDFIGGVKNFFNGLLTFFKGIFLIIKGIFLGDWGIILDGVKALFVGLGESIWGILKMVVTGCTAIFIGIVRIVWSVIKLILAPFIWLYNKLVGHSIIPDIINGIIDWFKKLPSAIWNAVKGIPGKIFNSWKNIVIKIIDAFRGIGKKIADKFVDMIPNWMLKIFKGGVTIAGKIGSMFGFADGGVVPGPKGKPTIAMVHGGETITPPGRGMVSSPNITINANISSDYDVRRLADELKRYWTEDFERVSMSRGI